MVILTWYFKYEEILFIKSNLVDILNALYSKEQKELNNKNVYNDALKSVYLEFLNKKLQFKEIEDFIEKHQTLPQPQNLKTAEEKIEEDILANKIFVEQQSGIYSRNYINISKSDLEDIVKRVQLAKSNEELDSILNIIIEIFEDFSDKFTGKLSIIMKKVINVITGLFVKIKNSEDINRKKLVIGLGINIIRYFNIWPYGTNIIDKQFLESQASQMIIENDATVWYSIEQKGKGIDIKVRYFLGEVDEYRFKMYIHKDEIVKYIGLQDSYVFMHKYLDIKIADIYFLLDLYDYFGKVYENFQNSQNEEFSIIIEEVIKDIKEYLKTDYALNVDELESILKYAYNLEQQTEKKVVKGEISTN